MEPSRKFLLTAEMLMKNSSIGQWQRIMSKSAKATHMVVAMEKHKNAKSLKKK